MKNKQEINTFLNVQINNLETLFLELKKENICSCECKFAIQVCCATDIRVVDRAIEMTKDYFTDEVNGDTLPLMIILFDTQFSGDISISKHIFRNYTIDLETLLDIAIDSLYAKTVEFCILNGCEVDQNLLELSVSFADRSMERAEILYVFDKYAFRYERYLSKYENARNNLLNFKIDRSLDLY